MSDEIPKRTVDWTWEQAGAWDAPVESGDAQKRRERDAALVFSGTQRGSSLVRIYDRDDTHMVMVDGKPHLLLSPKVARSLITDAKQRLIDDLERARYELKEWKRKHKAFRLVDSLRQAALAALRRLEDDL